MPFFAEALSIVLYCIQQLGIMLGVGSQTILLIGDSLASRDGTIDAKEEQFLHAAKRVIYFSLFCIIFSGVLITLMHLSADQASIVSQPAFLFKWMLIGAVTMLAIVQMRSTPSMSLLKAVTGGTWYGLFLVHILAPVSTWGVLLVLFFVWMVGFVACWSAIVFVLRQSYAAVRVQPATAAVVNSAQPIAAPRPIIKPTTPKPAAPPEPIVVQAPPQPPVPEATPAVPTLPPPPPAPQFSIPQSSEQFPYSATGSAPMLHPHLTSEVSPAAQPESAIGALADAQVTNHLPAIRVMPKSPKDLDTQHRGPLVKFG